MALQPPPQVTSLRALLRLPPQQLPRQLVKLPPALQPVLMAQVVAEAVAGVAAVGAVGAGRATTPGRTRSSSALRSPMQPQRLLRAALPLPLPLRRLLHLRRLGRLPGRRACSFRSSRHPLVPLPPPTAQRSRQPVRQQPRHQLQPSLPLPQLRQFEKVHQARLTRLLRPTTCPLRRARPMRMASSSRWATEDSAAEARSEAGRAWAGRGAVDGAEAGTEVHSSNSDRMRSRAHLAHLSSSSSNSRADTAGSRVEEVVEAGTEDSRALLRHRHPPPPSRNKRPRTKTHPLVQQRTADLLSSVFAPRSPPKLSLALSLVDTPPPLPYALSPPSSPPHSTLHVGPSVPIHFVDCCWFGGR